MSERKTRSTRSASKSVDADIVTTPRVKKAVVDVPIPDSVPSKKLKKEKSTSASKDLETEDSKKKGGKK